IGIAYNSKGDFTRAIETSDHAAAIAEQVGLPDVFWRARSTSGKALLALNRPDQARRAFDLAIASIEGLRSRIAGPELDRQRFFEDKLSPYHGMVELFVIQKNLWGALAYAERAKARVLSDVLEDGRVSITKAMTREEQEQERSLNAALVSLNAQVRSEHGEKTPDGAPVSDLKVRLEKARLAYEEFQTNLYAIHPELRAQRGHVLPINQEEAAASLPRDKSALLEYVVTENKTFLFVLTKPSGQTQAELKVYTIEIKRQELAARAEQFRGQLAAHDLDFSEPAAQLYNLLLRPAQAQLESK